jgi:integrase
MKTNRQLKISDWFNYQQTRLKAQKTNPKKTALRHESKSQNSLTKRQFRPKAIERNYSIAKESMVKFSEAMLQVLKIDGWSCEYESVNALLRHLARLTKSESSRYHYCWPVYKLCLRTGKNPDQLAKMPKERIEKIVQEFVDEKVAKHGCSHSYANNLLSWLDTFFRVNGFNGPRRLTLEKYKVPPRFRAMPEYVPTADEVWKMANLSGCLRDRAIILTLVCTGLRNSTLRAVRYGIGSPDPRFSKYTVKNELDRGQRNIAIFVFPEMKKLVPEACKNSIPYYTFTCVEATEAIRDYLRERMEKYGTIEDDEPLFPSEHNQVPKNFRTKLPLCGRHLSMIVKKTAKKAGLPHWWYVRAHSLRKTFETIMRSQPGDVRLDVKDQVFLMGHKQSGSLDYYYDMSKVEELREKYARMIFFDKPVSVTKPTQKLIPQEELEKYLAEGWRFVPGSRFPNGKVVIEKLGRMIKF